MINNTIFNIMFTIVPLLVFGGFIFTFALMFSPKLRAKFMGNQLKSTKYMLDENEEILRELNTKGANIQKDGITIKSRAVKQGFVGDSIYCKHCGVVIDSDSRFCKNCGKEQ